MLSGPSHSTVNHFVGTDYLSWSKVMLNKYTFSQQYSKAWKLSPKSQGERPGLSLNNANPFLYILKEKNYSGS